MLRVNKKALITGVTGQDGAYLAEFLLEKGYEVHGIRRRTSTNNIDRIDHMYMGKVNAHKNNFHLHYGDLTDSTSLFRVIDQVRPDEIYNLAAQSHVAVSFEEPEYTANSDALGALRLLEAMKLFKLKDTKFYQASTSELYGLVREIPQKESTPFYPRSPYAVAKLYAYWITVNYREAYNMYACNGILFNHESPLRGETFVTRKITRTLARIKLGLTDTLYMGNIDARRDWGHARDYIEMQWLMLQQDIPDDYVIATGRQHSVREFIILAAKELDMDIEWDGVGVDEKGIDKATGKTVVAIDPHFFRPSEVETLLGDATKAHLKLGWKPKISFEEMVRDMVRVDLDHAKADLLLKEHGYKYFHFHE